MRRANDQNNMSIFDSKSALVFITILKNPGRIIDVTRQFVQQFNYKDKEAVLGENISMFMPNFIAKHHAGYVKSFIET